MTRSIASGAVRLHTDLPARIRRQKSTGMGMVQISAFGVARLARVRPVRIVRPGYTKNKRAGVESKRK